MVREIPVSRAAMPACRCGQKRLRKDDGRNCPQMQPGNEFACWTAGNQRYLTSRFFHMSVISKAGTQCGREREALRDCLADRHWPIHGRPQMRQDGNCLKIFEAAVDVAGPTSARDARRLLSNGKAGCWFVFGKNTASEQTDCRQGLHA